jgi:hypothetical protein
MCLFQMALLAVDLIIFFGRDDEWEVKELAVTVSDKPRAVISV